MKIRLIEKQDIVPVLEIYRYYVENTAISFEYTAPAPEEFTERVKDISLKYPYLVAEEEGVVRGYAYAAAFKTRAAYDWSVETTVYVDRSYRGGGIGSALYRELENRLKAQNIQNLNACITYPNEQSIAFHERMGYKKTAHFEKCGYKFGRWLDMIWMQKFLGDHPEKPEPVIWSGRKIRGISY